MGRRKGKRERSTEKERVNERKKEKHKPIPCENEGRILFIPPVKR